MVNSFLYSQSNLKINIKILDLAASTYEIKNPCCGKYVVGIEPTRPLFKDKSADQLHRLCFCRVKIVYDIVTGKL